MLRLALIGGTDRVANYQLLAPRLREAQFTAVVERSAKEARKVAAFLGAETWSTSVNDLLTGHDAMVDAVIIDSAAVDPVDDCRHAFTANKHLLLASSALFNPLALHEITVLAANARSQFMWGTPFRFLPSVKTMKESLTKRQLGDLGLVRMHRWEFKSETKSTDNLLSDIDLIRWLFEQPPSLVFAKAREHRKHRPLKFQEYRQIHFGFPADGMALLDHDHVPAAREQEDYFSLSLIGSAGAAHADDHHNMQLLYGQGHPAALKTSQGNLAQLAQLQEFITSIAEDRAPHPGPSELQIALEIHAAVTKSIAVGRAMAFEPTTTQPT